MYRPHSKSSSRSVGHLYCFSRIQLFPYWLPYCHFALYHILSPVIHCFPYTPPHIPLHLFIPYWFSEKLHPGRHYSSQGGRGLPDAGRLAAQPQETCHWSCCRCGHGSYTVGRHSPAGPHNQREEHRKCREPLRNAGNLQDGM